MTTITSTEARKHLIKILDRVYHDKERVTITRRGKPSAVFVPVEDVELLKRIEDAIDLAEAREALKEVEREGAVTWEKIKKKLGL